MAKRGAGKQLTDQNWDEEEDTEEAGIFAQASDAIMKTREVKKAKRRGTAGQGGGTAVFKGFSGFGSAAPSSAPTFSFGLGESKGLSGLANGNKATSPEKTLATGGFKAATFVVGGSDTHEESPPKAAESHKPSLTSNGKSSSNKAKYLAQLRSLNESVSKWIKDHVDKNPYCILTPIFKDYDKHLAEIEKLNPDKGSDTDAKSEEKSEPEKTTITENKVSISSGFTFGTSTSSSSSSSTGMKPSPSTPSFTLGGTTSNASGGFSGFNFKPATSGGTSQLTPFSFAVNKPAESGSSSGATANQDDENYEPPKVEVATVEEEDAFYSKRCKLFYQKDGAWLEKGVGNIHLKPCNGKTQLLIRADTNLGNILLNIMLSSSNPTKRQGKNNVSLICIANPPMDPKQEGPDTKPTNMLIRVKTGDDADELLEKLEEAKKPQE